MRSTFRRRRDPGPGQGRRSLTLVPDYHVCVVEEKQIVGGVPEAMALMGLPRVLDVLVGELQPHRLSIQTVSKVG
jgi:L-lactate dehydrogenase complex protein LldG